MSAHEAPQPTTKGLHLSGACLALVLALTSLAAVAVPTASAHECAAYDGCDASTCVDGEEHSHTDYNRIENDEFCESHANPEEPPKEPCIIAGEEFPDSVCSFLCDKLGGDDCDAAGRSLRILRSVIQKVQGSRLPDVSSDRDGDGATA